MITKHSSSSSLKSCFSCFFATGNETGIGITMSRRVVDVDAEYTQAFHSKSFLKMWAQAHYSPRPTSFPLLEPTQSSLLHSAAAVHSGAALLEYLETTLQSFSACTDLLTAIYRTRSLHRAVRTLLFRHHAAGGGAAATSSADLAGQIDLDNPLSSQNISSFHRTHALFQPLLSRLSAEQRRLRRRARALRAAATAAIAFAAAVAVSAVIIATHAAAALVAVVGTPAVVSGGIRRGRRWVSLGWMEGERRRADTAARGAYIVWRDMETVSRMVRRVYGEVERRRDEVRMVVGSGAGGGMVKEVLREMEISEAGFQERIEELEEHVFLCLLTINRSRMMLAEEMAGDCGGRRR